MRNGQIHVSFRIAIVGAIISIVLIMSLLTSLIIYARGNADARKNARLLFTEKSLQTQERLNNRLLSLTSLASLGAAIPELEAQATGFGLNNPALGFLFRVVETDTSVYGAYAGWSNGDFLQLIGTGGNEQVLKANHAPLQCRYIVRAINGQGIDRVQRWSYLDASRDLLSQRTERDPAYDPRSRDWYRLAATDGKTHLGKAYAFSSLNALGITASMSFDRGVFGVDMTLSDIQGFLREATPSKRWAILLLEDGRRLLVASDQAAALLPSGVPPLGDIGDLSIVTADKEWTDPFGKVWLRQRSDWEFGGDTKLSLIAMTQLAEFTDFFDSIRLTLLLLTVMILIVVTPIALWISRQLSRPLTIIARDAKRVGAMDFSNYVDYRSWIAEIDELASGYAKMKNAISANRTLIAAQRDSFARFVPERMLELLDKSSIGDVKPQDSKTLELTVMFSDIRSYTAISEHLPCHEVFGLLNSYFEITNPIISANGGIIDKYIGDAIMSLFPHSPDAALKSVIAINRDLRLFNEERRKRNEPEILTGTGIHYGGVDLGTVGDSTRLQATVIGDAVNLASRLESATKVFGIRVLLSETAYARLENPAGFHLRLIDTVRVKGKERPINLYELFDLDEPEVMRQKAKSMPIFSEALQSYKKGEFEKARNLFALCVEECPMDTVLSVYIKRCLTLIRIPPGDDWAGVSTL